MSAAVRRPVRRRRPWGTIALLASLAAVLAWIAIPMFRGEPVPDPLDVMRRFFSGEVVAAERPSRRSSGPAEGKVRVFVSGRAIPAYSKIVRDDLWNVTKNTWAYSDIDASLDFYCNKLGLREVSRYDSEKGRFTNIFLAAPGDEPRAKAEKAPMMELTYNWDPEEYTGGRNFGHLAFRVENIYEVCDRLRNSGVTINRPPRDGYMAFVRSPDGISIELLQKGEALPAQEPWASMENTGSW